MSKRLRAVLLALSLVAVAGFVWRLLERSSDVGQSGEPWGLVPLSLALIVLTLALAGVLIRNLVVVVVERKRGMLGSSLRLKLVFIYLGLVLLPAIVLFWGSSRVIKETVEAILRTPLEQQARGEEIVASWLAYFQDDAIREARDIAEELNEAALDAQARAQLLESVAVRRDLALVQHFQPGAPGLAAGESAPAEASAPVLERMGELARRAISTGAPLASDFDRLGRGLAVLAAAPAADGTSIAVAVELPEAVGAAVEELNERAGDYQRFKHQRRQLVRFYVTLIALMFIATLFVATWIGLYVARRITEPIREVAAAAREISAGNLDVRVRAAAGDEMGLLVEAFNEMAAELEENREVITRSTADLRRSNKALDERRRYIETLVAHLSTAVFSLDPSGLVTTANPAVERILGVALRPGDDPRKVLAGRGLEPLLELLTAPGTSQEPRRDLELRDPAPTGHVSVQISPLVGQGDEHLGSLVMVEDLTAVLRAQKVLAWHEVARRIAHEIKNPLTPIQLAAQRLRKKFQAGAPDLDRVLVESTDAIEHEVTGLKQLVDEFSRFARLPPVAPAPVELEELVESVMALYRGVPGIEWDVELDSAVGLVRLDAQQIRRALINLVDNALAAMSGQGRIRIAARAIGTGGLLRIEVADSGPGIPAADREQMFVPYFSTKKKGTGLGLAIVHKVVTDHRGTIRVEDNRPHGAKFVIEIPA